jgi:biotin carboxyl carrier protein
LEPLPDEMKAKSADEASPAKPAAVPAGSGDAPPKSPLARSFNVFVGGAYYQVEVDPAQPQRGIVADPAAATAPPAAPASREQPVAVTPAQGGILAPMPGVLLRYAVEEGQRVKAGDPVVVLEAMKMENTLPSPVDGTVSSLPLRPGDTVAKDALLAIIAP